MRPPLHIGRADAILELALHRPERRNALSHELIGKLTEVFAAAARDADVRCVVLTGAPPAFCAGLDLQELAGDPAQSSEPDISAFRMLLDTIDRCPRPVVAAVNGPAAAGGAALVTACDVVVMAASATIGYPGVRHGLVAPIVLPYLLRCVAERTARYLLLTGELVPAARAEEIGLADAVVADEGVLERARQYAAILAAHPPAALRDTKAALLTLRPGPLTEPDGTRPGPADLHVSEESRRGVQRFLDR